jgi:hypothetical protein
MPETPSSLRRRARRLIYGLLLISVITPLQFLLRYGEVPGVGWGLTVFLLLLSALIELGTAFSARADYHTPLRPGGGWMDRLGAFWLAACAFTPLLGWVLTSAFPLTVDNWRLLYGLRAGLCFALPLVTALPLTVYLRGKSARVGAPILALVTAAAMLAGGWCFRDLIAGPLPGRMEVASSGSCRLVAPLDMPIICRGEWGALPRSLPVLYLQHTGRVIADPGQAP